MTKFLLWCILLFLCWPLALLALLLYPLIWLLLLPFRLLGIAVGGVLRWLADRRNNKLPQYFGMNEEELQAAGGHVEIERSRIQQGDLISVAAGTRVLEGKRTVVPLTR